MPAQQPTSLASESYEPLVSLPELDKPNKTTPAVSKPSEDAYNCSKCDWNRISKNLKLLEDTEGRIVWEEPERRCYCVQEAVWRIKPKSEKLGIVLHFNHFSFKWYESLEVYKGDRLSPGNVLLRYSDLTTAVMLLPHPEVSVWVRALPWPRSTVEKYPSSFELNYATHPLNQMPVNSSLLPSSTRVAPLVAENDAMFNCSSPYSVPSYIMCDMVQQCVDGEDEPANCSYRIAQCSEGWFPVHQKCFKIILNDTESCVRKTGTTLASLPEPAEREHIRRVIVRTGKEICLDVDLRKDLQLPTMYRYLWKWSKGVVDHGNVPLQEEGAASRSRTAKLLISYSDRLLIPQFQCNLPQRGSLCMEPTVTSTFTEKSVASSVHLILRSDIGHANTTIPSLKRCSDGSFVQIFNRCHSGVENTDWSLNKLKLFDCREGGQVHYSLVCDGAGDCQDGSDEMGCVRPRKRSLLKTIYVCFNNQIVPAVKT